MKRRGTEALITAPRHEGPWVERWPHPKHDGPVLTSGEACPLCQRAFSLGTGRPRKYQPEVSMRPVGRHGHATRRMHDHCHACGVSRGVICASCNATLTVMEHARPSTFVNGTLARSGEWRGAAVRYLRHACACYEARRTGADRPPSARKITRRRPAP